MMSRLAQLRAGFWIPASLALAISAIALRLLWDWSFGGYIAAFGALMAVYAWAAWCLLKGKLHTPGTESNALIGILVVAGLMRAIALFSPQALSTDVFRYVWDGRVQAAGVNPYRYIPADPALAALRDESIYPNINRADYAHTIYPPTAQLVFLAIERVSDGVPGMKLGMLLFDGVSIACLIALLRRCGMPATRVLLYAWHPLPIWEFAGAGHLDSVAIAFLLAAFVAASRRAPVWTGIALAAAALVKYYPVITGPALYRRWDWRMPVAFALTVALLYAPYVGAGGAVFGFLPGYASEEGLRDGSGIWLLALAQKFWHLPAEPLRIYVPLAAASMIGLSLWVQFPTGRRRREDTQSAARLAVLFTVLVSPHDPWYFTWLVPFLCFRISPALVWLTAACTLMYVLPRPTGLAAQSLIYVPFLTLLLLQNLLKIPSSLETFDAKHSARPASLL
jgi:hypothetical protein